MVFAILEINASTELLPNITLGFKLFDSCYNEVLSLMGAKWILSGKKNGVPNYNCNKDHMPLAIVGDMPSKASVPLARILGLNRYPQVSFASNHPSLSNKIQFPSFLRTTYNGDHEGFAIAQLVKYFNWTWVGIICSDDDLGISGAQLLTREIEKNGGCIAFQETLSISSSMKFIYRIIDVIKKSRAAVIVLSCTMESIVSLMEEISFCNVTDKVWVGTSGWTITSDFPRIEILTTLNGSLGISPKNGNIPRFKEFLYSIHPSIFSNDPYMKTFWENAFHCVWPGNDSYNNTSPALLKNGSDWCTGKERLDSIDVNIYDVYNFKYTYNVHNAVFALAYALHQMKNCVPGKGPFKNGACADAPYHQPWQLLHYIKKVVFNNTAGKPIHFDENGDGLIAVDILNWQLFPNGSNQYVHIGSFDASSPKGQELNIWLNKILWNGQRTHIPVSVCSDPCTKGYRRAAIQGQKICCFDCLPCSEGEILNPNDDTECLKCPEDKWPDSRKEKCLPKLMQFLSYEESLGYALACISILFCLLTFSVFSLFLVKQKTPIVKANNRELSYLLLFSLMFGFMCPLTFIGRPNQITCMIRQVMFAVIFSLCVSALLAKTINVIMIFSATNPDSKLKKLMGLRIPVYIVPVCTMIQIILCIVWLTTAAPFAEFNMAAEKEIIVIECNEGSRVLFACVLGYMGLLATISLSVAFLARKLPDTFNETKFITFSMLVFASVWVTFIPAYLSTKGKQTVAVEIFAILSSSSGFLVCIFFPKCYIILLHPEMNSKQYITRRNDRN
ncbi:extracellular calcium-sensing receptor-like [Xenopus laevis]|uniref:Extracellular calcium-sensing receptor-like n=1 Tax=Xenopus laevis TaxID=8355 RepID=A0A8J1LG21_XENLA|nr:extracellular calcium-sensing receptor-like [Xenopus laevis]